MKIIKWLILGPTFPVIVVIATVGHTADFVGRVFDILLTACSEFAKVLHREMR